jgi:hypothetical protein
MDKRQDAILHNNKGEVEWRKVSLNGSYGYDIMNPENFSKWKICNTQNAFTYTNSMKFKSTRKLNDDKFLIQLENYSYTCKTSPQVGFFVLDNAKYWYLIFIDNFMDKCLDMDKIMFLEGDTDSMYWVIAGRCSNSDDLNEGIHQGFKNVIKHNEFYEKHIFKYAPSNFALIYESKRPIFTTKKEKISFDNKLLGMAIEKECESMIALCSKCDTTFNQNEKEKMKLKGLSLNQNPEINKQNYIDAINDKKIAHGKNTTLKLRKNKDKYEMSKIEIKKQGLTAIYTKIYVFDDFSTCVPLIKTVIYEE